MASQLLSDIGSSLKQPHSFLKDLKSTVISHTPFVNNNNNNNQTNNAMASSSNEDSTITYNNDILTLSRVNQIDSKLKSDDVPSTEEMKELLEPFCDFDFSDIHYVNTILDKTKYDKRIEKRLLRFDKNFLNQKVFKGFDLNSQNLRQEVIDSFELNDDDLDDDLDPHATTTTAVLESPKDSNLTQLLNPALAGKKLVKGAMDAGKRFAKEVTEAGQEAEDLITGKKFQLMQQEKNNKIIKNVNDHNDRVLKKLSGVVSHNLITDVYQHYGFFIQTSKHIEKMDKELVELSNLWNEMKLNISNVLYALNEWNDDGIMNHSQQHDNSNTTTTTRSKTTTTTTSSNNSNSTNTTTRNVSTTKTSTSNNTVVTPNTTTTTTTNKGIGSTTTTTTNIDTTSTTTTSTNNDDELRQLVLNKIKDLTNDFYNALKIRNFESCIEIYDHGRKIVEHYMVDPIFVSNHHQRRRKNHHPLESHHHATLSRSTSTTSTPSTTPSIHPSFDSSDIEMIEKFNHVSELFVETLLIELRNSRNTSYSELLVKYISIMNYKEDAITVYLDTQSTVIDEVLSHLLIGDPIALCEELSVRFFNAISTVCDNYMTIFGSGLKREVVAVGAVGAHSGTSGMGTSSSSINSSINSNNDHSTTTTYKSTSRSIMDDDDRTLSKKSSSSSQQQQQQQPHKSSHTSSSGGNNILSSSTASNNNTTLPQGTHNSGFINWVVTQTIEKFCMKFKTSIGSVLKHDLCKMTLALSIVLKNSRKMNIQGLSVQHLLSEFFRHDLEIAIQSYVDLNIENLFDLLSKESWKGFDFAVNVACPNLVQNVMMGSKNSLTSTTTTSYTTTSYSNNSSTTSTNTTKNNNTTTNNNNNNNNTTTNGSNSTIFITQSGKYLYSFANEYLDYLKSVANLSLYQTAVRSVKEMFEEYILEIFRLANSHLNDSQFCCMICNLNQVRYHLLPKLVDKLKLLFGIEMVQFSLFMKSTEDLNQKIIERFCENRIAMIFDQIKLHAPNMYPSPSLVLDKSSTSNNNNNNNNNNHHQNSDNNDKSSNNNNTNNNNTNNNTNHTTTMVIGMLTSTDESKLQVSPQFIKFVSYVKKLQTLLSQYPQLMVVPAGGHNSSSQQQRSMATSSSSSNSSTSNRNKLINNHHDDDHDENIPMDAPTYISQQLFKLFFKYMGEIPYFWKLLTPQKKKESTTATTDLSESSSLTIITPPTNTSIKKQNTSQPTLNLLQLNAIILDLEFVKTICGEPIMTAEIRTMYHQLKERIVTQFCTLNDLNSSSDVLKSDTFFAFIIKKLMQENETVKLVAKFFQSSSSSNNNNSYSEQVDDQPKSYSTTSSSKGGRSLKTSGGGGMSDVQQRNLKNK